MLAVAVQNTAGPGGILGAVLLQSGSQIPPPGASVTQWLWTPDDNGTNDAAIMTSTNLDTSEIGYKKARDAYQKAGREIVDATIGGKLTIFPKVDYNSLF